MRSNSGPIDSPRARNLALQWLARREHSTHELREKLVSKGCDPELAVQTVEQLKAERLVSDERFIEIVISSLRRRGRGPLRIRQELHKKGIPKESVERWLGQGGGEDWVESLREVIRKKFGKKPPKDYAERAKRARFLQGRGFTFDQIQRVLDVNDTE